MKNKNIKYIFTIILLLFGLIYYIITEIESKQFEDSFYALQYNLIIENIEYKPYDYGFPTISFNNKSRLIAPQEVKIRAYIQIGDSISKESGTKTIKVYRKDIDGVWQEKIFN